MSENEAEAAGTGDLGGGIPRLPPMDNFDVVMDPNEVDVGEEVEEELPKCRRKGCSIDGAELKACGNPSCVAHMHQTCYQLILARHKLDDLPGDNVFCTKGCYDKMAKKKADQPGRLNWNSDGLNGPNDPQTSMKILLDWWMTEGNYSKYRGKNNDGKKKKEVHEMLAGKMTEGTKSTRGHKQVERKISHIEDTWRKAHDFAESETGQGLKENDEHGEFKEAVEGKCPYYFSLLDIMVDRASSRPRFTSDQLGSNLCLNLSDSDDEDSEKEEDGMDGVPSRDSTEESSVSGAAKNKKEATLKPKPKKPKRGISKRDKITLFDEDQMKDLFKASQAQEQLEARRLELEGRRLEIEEERKIAEDWKSKRDQLSYRMEQIQKYTELRDQYHLSDEKILELFPDMEQVVKTMNS